MDANGAAQPLRVALRWRSNLVRCLPRRWRHRLTVAYGNDPLQRAQLYLPAARGFPVVACVYGSFWHYRYDGRWAQVGSMLQEHGFGALIVRHRLWPPHSWPAPAEDVAAALAWTRARIAAHGGRADRIALLGHSSGAQLALLVALDRSFLRARGVEPEAVRAVAALGAPTDLEPRGDGESFGDRYVSGRAAGIFRDDVATMHDASPSSHVGPSMPPLQLVVGDRDLPVLAGDSEGFVSRCRAAGGDARLVRARGRDHMGLVAALVEDDPLRASVLGFLDENLR